MPQSLLICFSVVFAVLSGLCWHPTLAINELPQSSDDQYLGPYLGKIAFLFLTRGDIPHSTLWEVFFNWHAPKTHYSVYWHTQVSAL